MLTSNDPEIHGHMSSHNAAISDGKADWAGPGLPAHGIRPLCLKRKRP